MSQTFTLAKIEAGSDAATIDSFLEPIQSRDVSDEEAIRYKRIFSIMGSLDTALMQFYLKVETLDYNSPENKDDTEFYIGGHIKKEELELTITYNNIEYRVKAPIEVDNSKEGSPIYKFDTFYFLLDTDLPVWRANGTIREDGGNVTIKYADMSLNYKLFPNYPKRAVWQH